VSVNDVWTRLDRDEGGRFVSVRAAPQALASAVSHGAIGYLPAAQRSRYESHLAGGGLQRLIGSLLAWHAAGDIDHAAFRDRFLDGKGSDELIDHLRKAASGVAAATLDDLKAATTELAAAHQLMGAHMWPSFVSAAHGQVAVQAAVAEQPAGE
jgi:hypothetical protein